ncbi:hypothetical protein FOL47_001412 [Perkinsus chesapeaki]|uniref:Uncharacterized protein n=1 Tax=Perkinsus chesapeaki TaxID=330153 RepID=A0A7J6MJJ7_PERCH|nr:hypothetical protein FOL47_001412 [Perkinsus chesapeaki]
MPPSSIIEVSSTSSSSSSSSTSSIVGDDDDSSPIEWLWLHLKDGDNEYITAESLKRHFGDGVSDAVVTAMLQGKGQLTREEFQAVYLQTGLSVNEHGLPIDDDSKH